MRHFCLFAAFLSVFFTGSTYAQEFHVVSFSVDPADMSAYNYEKRTIHDDPSGLIKVITDIPNILFDAPKGVVDIVSQEEGYWVYIEPGEFSLQLMAPGYLLKDISLPETSKEHMVFELELSTKGVPITDMHLERVTFRMNEREVYIQINDKTPVLVLDNNAVFYIPAGERNFRFIKEGYADTELSIDAKDEAFLDVLLIPGQRTAPISDTGEIIVTSDPPGAEVYFNGLFVGNTPYEGHQMAGDYNLVLRKNQHHIHFEMIHLEGGVEKRHPIVEMKPYFGFWQVNTSPSGAEIYLDNEYAGVSPLLRSKIDIGSYELTAKKQLYHDKIIRFTIEEGDDKIFDLTLDEAFGYLVIASEPPGADIAVSGENYEDTTPFTVSLPEGIYEVTLSMSDYDDMTKTAAVKEGTTEELLFLLQPLPKPLDTRVRRHRTSKIIYGTAAFLAAGAGAYFQYSAWQLADAYPTATTDATEIYNRMDQHHMISYVALGAAVPFGVMALIKSVQQKRAEKQVSVTLTPLKDGAVMGLVISL